jgi:hypothetical protein
LLTAKGAKVTAKSANKKQHYQSRDWKREEEISHLVGQAQNGQRKNKKDKNIVVSGVTY